MNLKELATKPALVKLTIDDEEIVKQYGDTLDFYVYDKHQLDVFVELSTAQTSGDQNRINDLMSKLILDQNGKQVITKGYVLPPKVLSKALALVMDLLSK